MISRPKNARIKFDQAFFAPGRYPHVLRFELDESRFFILDDADIVVFSGFANRKDYSWVIRTWPAKL